MQDALIGELGQIGSLRVISRTMAARYQESGKPPAEIARKLGVSLVVEGSVLRSGDGVRIQVQLHQPSVDERPLWTQEYRRAVPEVLAMRGDIARAIAGTVRIELSPREAARLAAAPAVDPATYEAYLRGMYHLHPAAGADTGFSAAGPGSSASQPAVASGSTSAMVIAVVSGFVDSRMDVGSREGRGTILVQASR